jgi:hypothetical protein
LFTLLELCITFCFLVCSGSVGSAYEPVVVVVVVGG